MPTARIKTPRQARKGEIVEIKALITHPMETGYRRDNMGRAVPRHIIKHFTVAYGGEEVFAAELQPGIAANPFFAFTTVATETGDVVFTWTSDRGDTHSETRRIEVT